VVSVVILAAAAREVRLPDLEEDLEDHRREWAVRLSDSGGPQVALAAVLVDLQEASAVVTAKADSGQ
jgi:hypothetical protein